MSTIRAISSWDDWKKCNNETREWLKHIASEGDLNLVLYASFAVNCPYGVTTKDKRQNLCSAHLYKHQGTGKILPDPRKARHVAMFRFEAFWQWLQHYNTDSRIATLDVRDIMFQRHPFDNKYVKNLPPNELHVYAEGGKTTPKTATGWWIDAGFGRGTSMRCCDNTQPINVGAAIARRDAMDVYLRALVQSADVSGWGRWGADQSHATIVVYNKTAMNEANVHIVINHQGQGVVNTLGALHGDNDLKLFPNGTTNFTHIYNTDGGKLCSMCDGYLEFLSLRLVSSHPPTHTPTHPHTHDGEQKYRPLSTKLRWENT